MPINAWIALVGLGVTLFGMAIAGVRWATKIEYKVDTLWGFLIKRARVEVVNIGWGDMQSPVIVNATTIAAITPFIMDIVVFYGETLKRNPHIREQDLFIAIEEKFGDRIVEQVCIPHKVNLGACLIAVMQACHLEHGKLSKESGP